MVVLEAVRNAFVWQW